MLKKSSLLLGSLCFCLKSINFANLFAISGLQKVKLIYCSKPLWLLHVSFALEYTRCLCLKPSLSVMLRWTWNNSSTRGSRSQTDPHFFFAATVSCLPTCPTTGFQVPSSFPKKFRHLPKVPSSLCFSSYTAQHRLPHSLVVLLRLDSSTYRHVAQSQTEL